MTEPQTEAGRCGAVCPDGQCVLPEGHGDHRLLPREDGLDVERLAKAMTRVSRAGGVTVTWGAAPDSIAAMIAAEYAALAAEPEAVNSQKSGSLLV
jgi:hypothetical protein